jgi:hypothetical protein
MPSSWRQGGGYQTPNTSSAAKATTAALMARCPVAQRSANKSCEWFGFMKGFNWNLTPITPASEYSDHYLGEKLM